MSWFNHLDIYIYSLPLNPVKNTKNSSHFSQAKEAAERENCALLEVESVGLRRWGIGFHVPGSE